MTNKIHLKKSTEKLADFFAHSKAQMMGYSQDEPDYNKHYKKYFNEFCKEAVLHSMTPSGEIKANPIASAVKKEFSIDKVIDTHFKGTQTDAKIIKHQVDSAIQSLVSAFMQIRFGANLKSKNGAPSVIEYSETGVDEMLAVEVNRYATYMVAGMLYGYLEKFFNQPTEAFTEIFQESLPKDVNGEISLRSLRNKKNRTDFAKMFVEVGKNVK